MEYFAFQWHITDECDQRCKHCYIFSEGHPKLTEMPWERLVAVLANVGRMAERMQRTPYLYITGGDPILHSRFWDFLELVHSHGIPFTLMGNPFHLSDEVCQRMKSLGCRKYQLFPRRAARDARQVPQARLLRCHVSGNRDHPQERDALCHHVNHLGSEYR